MKPIEIIKEPIGKLKVSSDEKGMISDVNESLPSKINELIDAVNKLLAERDEVKPETPKKKGKIDQKVTWGRKNVKLSEYMG